MISSRWGAFLTSTMLSVALPGLAWAADMPSEQAEAAASDPRDIIVTARKREESLLKVPVIANAITQETLQRYNIQDLYAATTRVPGFSIGTGIVSAGPQVSIRGIGTTANNPTIDQSVSLNVDGMQFSQGMAYASGLFDVGQIEVLKGPQALFFGKNSPAGVISVRSADPTDRTEFQLRTGYEFEAKERIVEAVASGPVASALKLRLAGRFSKQDGFYTNDAVSVTSLGGVTPTDRDVNSTKSWILRGTALVGDGAPYSARIKATFSHDNVQNATPGQLAYCPDGTGAVSPVDIPFITGDDCKLDRSLHTAWLLPSDFPGIRNNGVEFSKTSQMFTTIEQNLDIGDALSLTSVTGFYSLAQQTLFAGGTTRAAVSIGTDNDFDIEDFTQELRLRSDFDGPLNFMAGAFYQDGRQRNHIRLRGNMALGLAASLGEAIHVIDIKAYSLFGQMRWNIVPTLELSGGVRWTDEERIHKETNLAPAFGPVGPVALLDPRLKSNNLSPEVTLTYTPSDNLTMFASYRQGFKSGSFNTLIYISPTMRSSFDDEQVKGGEVGLKTRLFDRALTLNLGAYYYRYSNLQVGANEVSDGNVLATRTINAASANVSGVDFDMTYAPRQVEGLTVRTAINYNHARYGQFANAPCGNGQTFSQGCDQLFNPSTDRYTSQNLSGRRLVRAPNWTGNIAVDYELPVGRDMNLLFGAAANYSSTYTTALVDLPGFAFGPFAKVDGNVALQGPGNAWEVALIGRNLTNKITTGQCFNSNTQNGVVFGGQIAGAILPGPAGGDEAVCLGDRGRELWVRLSFRLK